MTTVIAGANIVLEKVASRPWAPLDHRLGFESERRCQMNVDLQNRIPNNVGLEEDRKLQRALESWQPAYVDWWRELGPVGFQEDEIYLRTAVSVEPNGWAKFDYVRMPEYRWGIFLTPIEDDRTVPFGDNFGEKAWDEVPGDWRSELRRRASSRDKPLQTCVHVLHKVVPAAAAAEVEGVVADLKTVLGLSIHHQTTARAHGDHMVGGAVPRVGRSQPGKSALAQRSGLLGLRRYDNGPSRLLSHCSDDCGGRISHRDLLGRGAATSDGEKDERQKMSRHWGLRRIGPIIGVLPMSLTQVRA
jgi:hypothetical protein